MGENKINLIRNLLDYEKKVLIKILPMYLQDDFSKNSFIAGGVFYSLYNDNEPKDIDFFLTDANLSETLRTYFLSYILFKNADMKDKNVKISEYRGERLILTDNAISIGRYQIVTKWIGSPEVVVEAFDFKHNQFYMYEDKIDTLSGWEHLKDNVLRFNDKRPRDIAGCIIRTHKFLERGFTITNREMAKMLLKLNDVGFNDREMEILNNSTAFDS